MIGEEKMRMGLSEIDHIIQRISKDVHPGNIVGDCNNEIRIKVTDAFIIKNQWFYFYSWFLIIDNHVKI